ARLGRPFELELEIMEKRAGVYENNHNERECEAITRKALALVEHSLPPDDARMGWTLDLLAGAIANDRPRESVALQLRAIAILEHNGLGETTGVAGMYYNLALTYEVLRDAAAAERAVRHSLAIDGRMVDPDHPQVIASRVLLGGQLIRLNRFDE